MITVPQLFVTSIYYYLILSIFLYLKPTENQNKTVDLFINLVSWTSAIYS